MKALRNASFCLVTTILAGFSSGAYAADQCYQSYGECKTAAELAELGVKAVKFKPLGFVRDDFQTGWALLGFESPADGQAQALPLFAAWSEPVVGEDGAMAVQKAICADLATAGIACTRSYLDGAWRVYQAPGAKTPFVVSFKNEIDHLLATAGSVKTAQYGCQKDLDGQPVAAEIQCTGKYNSSLRLIYLANDTYVNLTGLTCAESGKTVALNAPSTLPACNADGAYAAQQWSPLKPSMRVKFVNEQRVHSVDTGISFYAAGW